ncbi:hypothetical protein ACH5RR_023240 [Cinchona calisaya]|uniref:Uncharacterized protein n=1 Tax=Cinchona calisaya TaxID=153742 RepID=A0ABD2ZB65_9GENT
MVLYFDGFSNTLPKPSDLFLDDTMKLDSILFTWPKYPIGKNLNKDVKRRDFEGDPMLESASEAYWDLSREISLDMESSEIEANFLDSELSSFLAPRVLTIHVLV